MKNLIFVLLTVIALSVSGCDGTPAEGSGSDTTDTSAFENMPVMISAETGGDYVIVRPDAGEYTLDAARQLRDAIKAGTGVEIPLKTDWYKGTAGTPPVAHEILVGVTNREESASAAAQWRKNDFHDWSVCRVGEKILIYGTTEDALAEAVTYFEEHFVVDGAVKMPENYTYTYTYAWPISSFKIGENDIGNYQIVVPATATMFTEIAAETVGDYLFENTGFRLPVVKDSDKGAVSEYEILIGKTSRSAPAPQENCGYAVLDGTRLTISGTNDYAMWVAASRFADGGGEAVTDGVYTAENTTIDVSDPIASGAVEAMKLPVAERAALAQQKQKQQLMKYQNAESILDVDIYGSFAMSVLYMPEDQVTKQELAFANKVLKKVAGYATTDIPTEKKGRVGGEIDFVANRVVRAFYAPEGRLAEDTAEALKRFFLNDDFMGYYNSENHILMKHTASYLAACHFENETFNQYKKTGAQLRAEEHDFLVEFMQFRARQGWCEFESMGYAMENIMSLLNLYDCAPDEDLRSLAKMSLDTIILSMITDSTENGMYGGAHARSYNIITIGMQNRIFWIYHLYFGNHDFTDTSTFLNYGNEYPVWNALFSDYRPDDMIYAIVADKTYPYSSYDRSFSVSEKNGKGNTGYTSRYTYNTELYSIGGINKQDSYTSEKHLEDVQQTNWLLAFAEDPKATITVHHPNENKYNGDWYGDSGCNCNYLFGHENVMMGIYYIPAANSRNYIHAYVNRSAFTQVSENADDGIIYLREGDVYVCLRFSDEYKVSPDHDYELLVYDGDRKSDIRIAMVCEVGDKDTYGSFSDFMKAMRKKTMEFDREALTLTYGNMTKKLDNTLRTNVKEYNYLNGELLSYHYDYTYNSPYMKAKWDSGVIEVYYGDYVRVMDYMNNTDVTEKK